MSGHLNYQQQQQEPGSGTKHRTSDASLSGTSGNLLCAGLYDDDDAQQRKSSISFDKIKQISLTYSLQGSEDGEGPDAGPGASGESQPSTNCPNSPTSDARKPSVIEVSGAKWTPLKPRELQQVSNQNGLVQEEEQRPGRYADTNPFASPYDSDYTNNSNPYSVDQRLQQQAHNTEDRPSSFTCNQPQSRRSSAVVQQRQNCRTPTRSPFASPARRERAFAQQLATRPTVNRPRRPVSATSCGVWRPHSSASASEQVQQSSLAGGSLGLRLSQRHNSISLVVFSDLDQNIVSATGDDESCSDNESVAWHQASAGSGRLRQVENQRVLAGECLSCDDQLDDDYEDYNNEEEEAYNEAGDDDEDDEVEYELTVQEEIAYGGAKKLLVRDQNEQQWKGPSRAGRGSLLGANNAAATTMTVPRQRDLHSSTGPQQQQQGFDQFLLDQADRDRDQLVADSDSLDFVRSCKTASSAASGNPLRQRRPLSNLNHGKERTAPCSYPEDTTITTTNTEHRCRPLNQPLVGSQGSGNNSVHNQDLAAQLFAASALNTGGGFGCSGRGGGGGGGTSTSDKSYPSSAFAGQRPVIGNRNHLTSTNLNGNGEPLAAAGWQRSAPQARRRRTTVANDASAHSLASDFWLQQDGRSRVQTSRLRSRYFPEDSDGRGYTRAQRQDNNSAEQSSSPRRGRRIDIVIGSPHREQRAMQTPVKRLASGARQLEAGWSSPASEWQPRNNIGSGRNSHQAQHSSASSGGSLGGWSNYGPTNNSPTTTTTIDNSNNTNNNARPLNASYLNERPANRVQRVAAGNSNHYLANEIIGADSRCLEKPSVADLEDKVAVTIQSSVEAERRATAPTEGNCQPTEDVEHCRQLQQQQQVDVGRKEGEKQVEIVQDKQMALDVKEVPSPQREPARCPFVSPAPPTSRPLKLRNLLNDEQSVDNLHSKYKQNNKSHGCNETRCLGSMLNPKPVENKVRSASETMEQARDFINNFYASIKRTDSPAHKNRLAEIEEQLKTTDTYYLKETELIYGAKLAWRNASRCIGRIQWSKLQVFDARFTTNANEMFEALCNHIKYATNKGSLRSAITILPQRVKSTKNDWRIWNSQLLGYAAYKDKETGKIIGDPANVEMTEVCQKLGWRGKGTRFDILPLVLTANGQPPQMFPLPEDLVLRVKLKHPKYKWFEELGLEWYALPAVSSMMLDVGGLQFTAAPFSGWYMVTEIGTRDLGDACRYNVLEEVAQRMGLNTTSNMSLWKDQAVVELNIAVLDSFQQAGVTIVDHHTASETFMTHLANEQRLRGGCPADWVWLVPPTAGSTTQVFHQEMVNYHLLPNYEYMESCWKNFDWVAWEQMQQDKLEDAVTRKRLASLSPAALRSSPSAMNGLSPSGRSLNNVELTPRKIRFKEIARAVKFTSKLFGKALSRRIKATILYATETGKSERFANKLAQTFSCAFNVHLMSMSDYDLTCLEHEALLLVVTSTFGNGDPPENGELFAKHLAAVKLTGDTSPDIDSINSVSTNPFFQMLSEDHKDASLSAEEREDELCATSGSPKQDKQEQQTNIRPLSNVRFGVFALGSTAYPHFCAFGRYVDQTLGELGAERILKCTTGDELCGQEKAFNEWSNEVFKTACDVFCLTDSIGPIEERPELLWSPLDVKFVPVEIIGASLDLPLSKNGAITNGATPDQTPVTRSTDLLSSKKTITRNLMSFSNKKIIPFTVKDRRDLHSFNQEENLQTLCLDLESEWISAPGVIKPVAGSPSNNSTASGLGTKQIQINATNSSSAMIPYEAGDHVAIYPTNKSEMVEKILDRMRRDLDTSAKVGPSLDFDQVYTILVKRENMDLTPAAAMAQSAALGGENTWITHDRLPVTSIREALTRYLDITSPPNQEFLSILARQTSDQDEKKRLQQMARNFTIYEEWKNKRVPTLVSVLDEFKTIKFEPALVTQIPLIKPRFYSVSGTFTFSLTVGVVRFKTATGELREGLCSNYLNTITMDPRTYIYGYIRSAQAFHMPQDKSIPMILISAGTGIAPFRSFWQQRYADMYKGITQRQSERKQQVAAVKSLFGRMEMYFGCRNSNYILYKDELDEMYENGVLSSVNIAFSRPIDQDVIADDGSLFAENASTTIDGLPKLKSKVASIKQARKKMYVQDKLLEYSDDIYRLIMLDGAHLYVCGDVAMADGVYKTLTTIINNSFKANKLSENCDPPSADSAIDSGLCSDLAKPNEDGETVLMNLRNLNRYHEDIFGAKQMS